jgi:hypothetical protein
MQGLTYLHAPEVLQISVRNPLVKEDNFLQKIPFEQKCFVSKIPCLYGAASFSISMKLAKVFRNRKMLEIQLKFCSRMLFGFI